MKLYRTKRGIYIESEHRFYRSDEDWDTLLNRDSLFHYLAGQTRTLPEEKDYAEIIQNELLAPIRHQEIWAAGVTYFRSKKARMEESKEAGGGDFYDRVYDAARPELFFKSTAARAKGPGEKVRIRRDSAWNVPEPELTLFINSSGVIAGYTVGNDMSSRDIEGENPLYLPQAKTYDGSAGIGPCLYVTEEPLPEDSTINMEIIRDGKTVFEGSTQINQIKRKFTELASYLFFETTFPYGAFLMTGTGIVPTDEFTLQSGDEIRISIDPIGTLVNFVE